MSADEVPIARRWLLACEELTVVGLKPVQWSVFLPVFQVFCSLNRTCSFGFFVAILDGLLDSLATLMNLLWPLWPRNGALDCQLRDHVSSLREIHKCVEADLPFARRLLVRRL